MTMIREHCQDPVMRWNKTNRFVKAIRLIPEQRELRRGHSVINSEKVPFFSMKSISRKKFREIDFGFAVTDIQFIICNYIRIFAPLCSALLLKKINSNFEVSTYSAISYFCTISSIFRAHYEGSSKGT